MERTHGAGERTSTCMTKTQPHADETSPGSEFYLPGMATVSDRVGRIEQFLTSVYRVHRFRGGVTARAE